jgi:hypothetical protein
VKAAKSAVPQVLTETEARRMIAPFQGELSTFDVKKSELLAMSPGPLRANLALEYARDAKKVKDQYGKSELREHILSLHRTHRFFSGIVQKRLLDPADDLLVLCNRIRAEWELTRRRQIEETRRQREAQLLLDVQLERAAEVQHLQELGRVDEAAARAEAPLAVPTVNIDEDAGKPADESMAEVWRPARDADENLIFTDLAAYLHWVADNPAMHHLVKHEYGKLKKLLTDNRGLLQPPGLSVEHSFEPRTRAEP